MGREQLQCIFHSSVRWRYSCCRNPWITCFHNICLQTCEHVHSSVVCYYQMTFENSELNFLEIIAYGPYEKTGRRLKL